MGPIFILTLRQLAGRWRLFLILSLAGLPVVLISVIRLVAGDPSESGADKEGMDVFFDGLFVGAILPVIAMALATAAFGNEMEDRTLSYLMLKPVSRMLIAFPKLGASIAMGGPVLVVSGVATMVLASGDARAAAAVGVALLVGLTAYAAIFTWAGLVTRSALGMALLYVFVWEGLISTFLAGTRYLSVRGYVLAIMHGIDTESFEVFGERVIELPAAIGGAAVVTVAFFLLTVYRLRRMDVP